MQQPADDTRFHPQTRSLRRGVVVAAAIAVVGTLGMASLIGTRPAQLLALGTLGVVVLVLDIATLKRVLLGVLLFEFTLPVDIYLDYDAAVAARNTVSGFSVSLSTFALVVLYTLMAAERLAGVRARAQSLHLVTRVSLVYPAIVLASAVWAIDSKLVFYEFTLMAQAALAAIYIAKTATSRRDLVFVMTVLTAGLGVQSILAIGAMGLGTEVVLGPVTIWVAHGRAAGTFGSPNVLGSFLTFMLAPALALVVMKVSRLHTVLAGSALGVGGIALLLSQSRGAWVGAAIAMAIFVVAAIRRRWVSLRSVAITAAAGLVAMIPFSAIVLERIAAYDNTAAQARFPLYELAWGVVAGHPVLGVGANNFAEAMINHLTVDFSNAWISTVHNKYLLVWAELGFIGLVAFLVFVLGIVWYGWRLFRMRDARLSPLGLTVICSMAGVMIHMLVELFHARTQYQALWILAALVQGALALEIMESPGDHGRLPAFVEAPT